MWDWLRGQPFILSVNSMKQMLWIKGLYFLWIYILCFHLIWYLFRALVLGGSGGVGTFAIQLLKSWGANVSTTCAADAIDFVYNNTGADQCFDYETNELVGFLGSFDFVLNAASNGQHRDLSPEWGLKYLRKWKGSKYVTLSSPLLNNSDRFGPILGTGMSALKAIEQTIRSGSEGQSIRWAFYWPNGSALKTIAKLVESNQIKAVIDKRFPI